MIILGTNDAGDVVLDLDELIRSRMLIQANSGAGKSWALRKLIEVTHGHVQQIVLDLEGEFPTLREKYPDFIIAGKGGDTPCDPKSAKLLARKLLELRVSAVCDLSELQAHERIRFVRLFLEALVAAPQALWHPVLVVLDEAHHFAPEVGQAESSQAVIDLCTRGRKRGFAAVLATQRLAKLHKDATAELINVMVGRTGQDIDQKRAGAILGFSTAADIRSLRDLEPGEFYAFGPALSRDVIRFKVGPVVSRHPKVGELASVQPVEPTDEMRGVLAQLADLPGEAAEEARTVEELRRELSNVRSELTVEKKRTEPLPCDHEATMGQLSAEIGRLQFELDGASQVATVNSERFHVLVERVDALPLAISQAVDGILYDIKALPVPDPAPAARRPARPTPPPRARTTPIASPSRAESVAPPSQREPAGAGTDPYAVDVRMKDTYLTPPRQKILDSIAAFEPLGLSSISKSVIAAYSGVSPTSGGYFNNLGALRSAGYIEYPQGGYVALTDAGRELAHAANPISGTAELHGAWLALLTAPRRAIVRVLIDAYPDDVGKDELADQVGVSRTSGGYFNNLGALRSLGLIEYPTPGRAVATNLLFPEGVPN